MKGDATITAFLAEHGADRDLLNGSKEPRLVAVRTALIRRLKATGLNNCEIARCMRMDRTTIAYWLRDEVRQDKIRRQQAYRDAASA